MNERLLRAANLLRASRSPVVLTGAGVSKESGIATFRDALTGLWSRYNPAQLATPTAFQRDPKLVWDFYQHRREIARQAVPNPGHRALAALERSFPGLTIITQNVDDLHEAAGSGHVVRLHGLLDANRCSANCRGNPTPVELGTDDPDVSGPPPCPYCGAPVRPDVVWFDELLPSAALNTADRAIAQADLMLIVGTSGVVYPAAEMPVAAQRHGARLIEVNPLESTLTPIVDIWLPGASGETLPRLIALFEQSIRSGLPS